MNFYQFIIPRLNGSEIETNFNYYLKLVKKGIAGFIVFGGELEKVRSGLIELKKQASKPLIIASDLEQGLGQHLAGGTLFPPAMAMASAVKQMHDKKQGLKLLRDAFKAIALEARYAGINTIFAPVLDINTNPLNPIIGTRSFGEDKKTVSFFGCEMIKIFQKNGIVACGKHFPGHGDTKIDSHISLPSVNKRLKELQKTELVPFKKAIEADVKMIMLGHLKVLAIDPSGIPVSLSEKAVKFLRKNMKYKGILITDALNMGGISGYSEEEACLKALRAGIDFLLHPTDTEKTVLYLQNNNINVPFKSKHKKSENFLKTKASTPRPNFEKHGKLSEELAIKAIRITGRRLFASMRIPLEKPLLIILNDDEKAKGQILIKELKKKYSGVKCLNFKKEDSLDLNAIKGKDAIVAVFSKIKAWKGGSSPWIFKTLKKLEKTSRVFISFGSPYLIDNLSNNCTKIYAYWDSETSQEKVAELI